MRVRAASPAAAIVGPWRPAFPVTAWRALLYATGYIRRRWYYHHKVRETIRMSELAAEETPAVADAAREAASGHVVYITVHGKRLAGIVPAEIAAELENLSPEEFRELLEDFADAQAAREALAEIEAGAEPIPAEQVWAELGI
jgi:antitoxin (DNA-binding transcriptional repressor) of toxin-antitoxin stability system